MLPLSSFRALASIFQWIEDHKQWPACLSQWFLVLLRKTNIAVPTWADLRPITVAASLYRLWARVKFFATSPCSHGIWWHLLPSTQAVSYTPGPAEFLGFSRTEVLVWFVLTYPPLPFGVLSLIFWITRTIEVPKWEPYQPSLSTIANFFGITVMYLLFWVPGVLLVITCKNYGV